MKLHVKEQLICFLLTAMLFMMGMQADIVPVNPSFLCVENQVTEQTVSSAIRSGSYLTAVEKECTMDMLRKSESAYQNSNDRSVITGRFSKIAILLLITELFLLQRFYFIGAIEDLFSASKRCHIATVQYIHQKDGKK